jgi:hypothetical protein
VKSSASKFAGADHFEHHDKAKLARRLVARLHDLASASSCDQRDSPSVFPF